MRFIQTCAITLMLAATGSASSAKRPPITRVTPSAAPRIEVLFVLDTTNSMSGLIEGAKQKIWYIANQMLQARPMPRLRLGLLGYRDRGDAYITQFTDLTEDVDAVYAQLTKLEAGGGGDGPESVNQALHEAVTRARWSQDRAVLKLIFLVGDAPPHMDYQDDVKYPKTCELAAKRDLIINTIQCGGDSDTQRAWQDIAHRAEGAYTAIAQTGGMHLIATPMDAELAKLNAEVGHTIVAFGAEERREKVMAKQALSESVAASAPAPVADRLAFNASTGRVVQGEGELLDSLKKGEVTLEKIEAKDLPAEMKPMTLAQRKAYVKTKEDTRAKLQTRITELIRQRQAYLDAEARKGAGKADSFDTKVAETLRTQAKRKGIVMGAGK